MALCAVVAFGATEQRDHCAGFSNYQRNPVSHSVQNEFLYTSIQRPPNYGTVAFENGGSISIGDGTHTFTYVPDADYIGYDTLRVQYFKENQNNGGWITVNMDVYIAVYPTYIKAVDDFAITKANTTITIDVLANDDGVGGGLFDVESISNVNSGTAVCAPNCMAVEFTPEPGFVGIAHLNYTICDQEGSCDDAIVNITITPTDEPMTDTIQIITSRDIPKVVLLDLINYEEDPANPPLYGTVDLEGEVPTYTPDADFAGYDYFNFIKEEGGNVYRRFVEMHILDVPTPNRVLIDDHAYTTENMPVLINVRANDVGSSTTSASEPAHGTVSPVSNGVFAYEPEIGFYRY